MKGSYCYYFHKYVIVVSLLGEFLKKRRMGFLGGGDENGSGI